MVRDEVVATLAEMGISDEQMTDDAHLQSDLELDSTEVVQIALEMKRRFGVEVKLEAGDDLTIGEVCKLVEERLRDASRAPA